MEIKTILQKPYTFEQKRYFILLQNRQNGYEIRETETALEAWGKTTEELLAETKEAKLNENTIKAKQAIEDGYVIYKEAQFETNTQTLSDLGDERNICLKLGQTSTMWLSKDDKAVELILDDIDTVNNDDIFKIGLLAKRFKNQIWNERYLSYLRQIEACTTKEEIEAIVIDYTVNEVVEESTIEEPVTEKITEETEV